ncbi:response regulator [Fibrobacterota bacterium]
MTRILVIDDNRDIRDSLREILECKGYEVTTAIDGNEGYRMFQKERVDLIIMDIVMPGKDGLETIWDMRKEVPDVKIIAISGGIRSGKGDLYLELSRKMGVKYSMEKPLDIDKLLSFVEELAGK